MVPEEPPAPAARVELGLALRRDSLWSAAARRRKAARGPPGGVGEEVRAMEETEPAAPAPAPEALESGPDSAPEVRGEAARGEALNYIHISITIKNWDPTLGDKRKPMRCLGTTGVPSTEGRSVGSRRTLTILRNRSQMKIIKECREELSEIKFKNEEKKMDWLEKEGSLLGRGRGIKW